MAAWSFTKEESYTFSICQTICYFALYCNFSGFSSWLLSTLYFADHFTAKEPAWFAKKMKLAGIIQLRICLLKTSVGLQICMSNVKT